MTGENRPGDSHASGSPGRHHVFFTALVAGAALLASAIFANDWLQRDWLAKKWLFRSPDGLVWIGVFAAVSCSAFGCLLATWKTGVWRSTSCAPLRWTLPVVAVAWMLTWRIEPPTLAYDAQLALCGALAVWCVLVALSTRVRDLGRRRILRVVDILVCELAACLILAEVGLRIVRSTTDTSWLATASTSPAAWVRAHRLAPGAFYMGFRVNREGFADVEPERVQEKQHRVVCIGDSFAVGVVPHHLHYTTVAEGFFTDLEVYNAGVVNTGPREYLEVVRASALPLRPELVVVTLFVGNDFTDALRGEASLASTLTDRNEVLVRQLVKRLAATWSERRAGGAVADPLESTMTAGQTDKQELTPAEADRAMPWLADPLQEKPALSEERFGYVEVIRSEVLRPGSGATFEPTFDYLDRIRELARPAPLACLLIPDEFQVEDELWGRVRASAGLVDEDRDRPQKVVAAWLESRGIPFVDLLPRLRAVTALADGHRHVYHLRDTHFNARGNRIAGEAIAELVERTGVAKRADPR